MRSIIFLIAVLLCFGCLLLISALLEQGYPTAFVVIVLPATLCVVMAILSRMVRRENEINAFSFFAALLGMGMAAGVIIWLLTFIGPVPIIAVVIAMSAAVAFLMFKRNERQRALREVAGKCPLCGYDLRASHERCPECGADLPEELQRRRRVAAELRAKHHDTEGPGQPVSDDQEQS